MGKAKTERRLKDNEAQAVARTIRVSPQKLNLVAALIRGKKVERIYGDVFEHNLPMLQLAESLGFKREFQQDAPGLVRVVLNLNDAKDD